MGAFTIIQKSHRNYGWFLRGCKCFFSIFFAGVFQPWKGADFLEGKTGCDLFCGNLPAGLSCEVPPSGRGICVGVSGP